MLLVKECNSRSVRLRRNSTGISVSITPNRIGRIGRIYGLDSEQWVLGKAANGGGLVVKYFKDRIQFSDLEQVFDTLAETQQF